MPAMLARLLAALVVVFIIFLIFGGWRWLNVMWQEWKMTDKLADFGNWMYNKNRPVLVQWIWLILIIILILVGWLVSG